MSNIMSKCPLIALILLAFYLQTRVTKLCEDINQKLMYENSWANDFKFQLTVTNFIYRTRANKGRSQIVAAPRKLPKICAFF